VPVKRGANRRSKALHTSVSLGMPLHERSVLEPMFGVIFADGYRSTVTGVSIARRSKTDWHPAEAGTTRR